MADTSVDETAATAGSGSEEEEEVIDHGESIFTVTRRFKDAIALFNTLDVKLLMKVMTRVVAQLGSGGVGAVFNAEEEEQLQEHLDISAAQLQTVLGGTAYVFEQAAYHAASAARLHHHLHETHELDTAPAMAFGRVWTKASPAMLTRLQQHTLGAPAVLRDVDWRLQLTMSHQRLDRTKDINAVFDFVLGDASANSAHDECISVEATQTQVEALYESMERIQQQLDALT